jgi:arginine decarboxylase
MQQLIEKWKIQDALETYGVRHWGKGYFSINKLGHVTVHPNKDPEKAIDLKELVDQIQARGIALPLLLRFTDILRHRVGEIHEAFRSAIQEFEYAGNYCCVYPIKVNQQRQVVEEILDFGKDFDFGLEAGSKPELLAVLALTNGLETPIICNGFKDDEFIKMTVLARKIGKKIIPVIEKFSELETLVRYAEELGVRPIIGVRVKLAARGAGRWKYSAGFRSKFGLTLTETLEAYEYLKQRDMADCLQLVHFHMGSQITNIRNIKSALTEAARVYVELHRVGANLRFLDVGGGLGIDYDGSQSDFESSVNYTLQEYANDVVFRIKSVCDEAGVPHPTIVSESGRAVVAYHSLLVFDVLGVFNFDRYQMMPEAIPEDAAQQISDLFGIHRDLSKKNLLESYHDAVQAMDEALNLFNVGSMTIEDRALTERLFWAVCGKVRKIVRELDYVPEELQGLEALLSDTYFCNFSIFQSMPDSWAIKQLFPILPIHRLNEPPTRRAVLGDITCDSDGKIDQFIDLRDVRNTLELHPFDGQPYYLGAFLLGAYQEILGDLHNLFGDTNAVHVSLDDDGVSIDTVIKGDTVREVLAYVQYSADELMALMRKDVERAVRSGKISLNESKQLLHFYESGLEGYTYLEEP